MRCGRVAASHDAAACSRGTPSRGYPVDTVVGLGGVVSDTWIVVGFLQMSKALKEQVGDEKT
jgi:hypothetical protein